MALTMEFRPSTVPDDADFSRMQNGGEMGPALSACLRDYLIYAGDTWDIEFSWLNLTGWLYSQYSPDNEHSQRLRGVQIIPILVAMKEGGYFEEAGEQTYRLTEAYIEFYRTLV